MPMNPMTARLRAAALTLSLIPTAPALAGDSDLAARQADRAGTHEIESAEPRSQQLAMSGTGAFFDVNHTQTVETKRLKRRRTKR